MQLGWVMIAVNIHLKPLHVERPDEWMCSFFLQINIKRRNIYACCGFSLFKFYMKYFLDNHVVSSWCKTPLCFISRCCFAERGKSTKTQFYMLIHALCNLNFLMLYGCFISHSNEKPIRLQHPPPLPSHYLHSSVFMTKRSGLCNTCWVHGAV